METQLDQAQWAAFFNDFAKTHHGYEARLELIGREFGDQEEADWLPLAGISYDPHYNHIIVTVGGISRRYPVHLTHTVERPKTVQVQHAPNGDLASILLVAADETELLVHLRQQPRLSTTGA